MTTKTKEEEVQAKGEREELIAMGDKFLKEGLLRKAVEAYKAAGAKDKLIALLIAIGDEYLKKGLVSVALEAYKAAGERDRLLALGNKFVEKRLLHKAFKAYKAAAETELPSKGQEQG